jgi:hypothetical protein
VCVSHAHFPCGHLIPTLPRNLGEREQNEHAVLEALGRGQVKVTANRWKNWVTTGETLTQGRFIAQKISTGWGLGVVKSPHGVERRRVLLASLQSSISQKRTAGLKN